MYTSEKALMYTFDVHTSEVMGTCFHQQWKNMLLYTSEKALMYTQTLMYTQALMIT